MAEANQTFGKWTLVNRVQGPKKETWACRCSCGTVKPVRLDNLKLGVSRSCGCERAKQHAAAMRWALRPSSAGGAK